MAEPEKTDVLQFMAVRSPSPVTDGADARDYIRDHDRLPVPLTHVPDERDGGSAIARLVVDEVFCQEASTVDSLVEKVVELLPVVGVDCDAAPPPRRRGLLALDRLEVATRFEDDVFRFVPDRLEYIQGLPLAPALARARGILEEAAAGDALDRAELLKELAEVFDGQVLWTVVFADGRHSDGFRESRRGLFDALYVLYILRRRIPVNLEDVLGALGALHALEWLAIDAFIEDARGRGRANLDASETALLAHLESTLPELRRGLEASAAATLIATPADLRRFLSATAIVHPIFARLHGFRRPFNPIRPLGIGDLKVVKQWLVEYLPGEISHIANVLKGETNERSTRRLDRTEEQFGFSSETTQDVSSESSTTDRLEVKREAENVVKTDIGVKADAYFRYDNKMIQAGVSGGFAYNRSSQDSSKSAQQLAREVIDKAVSRVQSRVTEQRSVTKLFENEETVKHVFDNKTGTGHVTGFYRFIDKRYTAQLFNYGKRLMFEFIVPEPAAFLVESRLRAFETGIDVPQPPSPPTLTTVNLGFTPAQIDKAKWETLRTTYDLAGLPPYPAPWKSMMLLNQENSSPLFTEKNIPDTDDNWWAKSYSVRLNAEGYEVRNVRRSGSLYFVWWTDDANVRWRDRNFHNLALDGQILTQDDFTQTDYKAYYTPIDDIDLTAAPHAIGAGGDLTLTVEFQNVKSYFFTFVVDLALTADALGAWQAQVYNAVKAVEQERVDARNREAQLAYDTAMADYRRELAAVTGTTVNSLLEGGSDAANRRVIELELRKHCLSELAKEFDADDADDRLSTLESVGGFDVDFTYRRLVVTDVDGATVVSFAKPTKGITYPATDLPAARRKGRHLQFLEQAFEWDKLAYLFYPYFWATPPKWIELTARADDADPVYSAFLQAGAARVLVAVSPGYRDAVLHYLATGEPWDGGPAPVIGDELYVPLYEELREQQDDLENATAEGEPWTFMVPTSLVYLEGGDPLPAVPGGAP